VECKESKSSSTVLGVSWTDCIATFVEPVVLTTLLLEPSNGLGDVSPIGNVNVVVFPTFCTELTPEDAFGGIKAVCPLEITVILRLGDFTGILD
jgi:hypothetical protein